MNLDKKIFVPERVKKKCIILKPATSTYIDLIYWLLQDVNSCELGYTTATLQPPSSNIRRRHFGAWHATVANAYTGSLKSLHTFFDTYFNHMLEKFELNRMVWNVQNFKLLDKKKEVFWIHFWQSVDAILQEVSEAETFV